MIVVVNKYLFKKRFVGLTLWPFVVIKRQGLKHDKVFINHERIHLRQQLELLILPFYLWYGIEFIVRWLQYGNRFEAYRNISFEREAYGCEEQEDYLAERRVFRFLKYL